jgi:hypothetical protein
MSKLENIVLEYSIKLLNAANGKENPTVGELVDKPKEQIKALMLELIGEDVPLTGLRHPDEDEWHNTRNKLKSELRKKVEEL